MAEGQDAGACELCGSQDFHDEDGRPFCTNGHQQEGPQRVEEDEADYGTQGKLVRKKTEVRKVKVSKVYRGERAYRLFILAFQHLLWQQCYTLVHEKSITEDLWTVVRDLWALRLSKQAKRTEGTAGSEEDTKDPSSAPVSSEETEYDSDNETEHVRTAEDSPVLIESVALCYMGMLLLRLPVSLATLFRWIRDEDMVYFRAIRHVPADMRDKLPGEYHEALDTQSILRCEDLQNAVFHHTRLYNRTFGLGIPPINSTLLLFDHIRALALPLEVVKAVMNLNQIVSFDFRYDVFTRRKKTVSLPEAQLISLIIIVVKLIYPFDSNTMKCCPRNLNEPAAQQIDWDLWLDTHKQIQNRDNNEATLHRTKLLETRDTDVFGMTDSQLDAYMDWYQRTWTKEDTAQGSRDDLTGQILDMFPLETRAEEPCPITVEKEREKAIEDKLREVQAHLKLRRPITDHEVEELQLQQNPEQDTKRRRPGSHYAIFRDTSELSKDPIAKAFHEAAAEVACLELGTLLRAVLQTERKIDIWRNAKRRAERFGESMDLDAEMGARSDRVIRSIDRRKGKQRAGVGLGAEDDDGLQDEDESEGSLQDDMEMTT